MATSATSGRKRRTARRTAATANGFAIWRTVWGSEPLGAEGPEIGGPVGRRAGRAREERDLVARLGEGRAQGREVGLDAPLRRTQSVIRRTRTPPAVPADDSSAASTTSRLRRPSASDAALRRAAAACATNAAIAAANDGSAGPERAPRSASGKLPRRQRAAPRVRSRHGGAAHESDERWRSTRSVPRSPISSTWSAKRPGTRTRPGRRHRREVQMSHAPSCSETDRRGPSRRPARPRRPRASGADRCDARRGRAARPRPWPGGASRRHRRGGNGSEKTALRGRPAGRCARARSAASAWR